MTLTGRLGSVMGLARSPFIVSFTRPSASSVPHPTITTGCAGAAASAGARCWARSGKAADAAHNHTRQAAMIVSTAFVYESIDMAEPLWLFPPIVTRFRPMMRTFVLLPLALLAASASPATQSPRQTADSLILVTLDGA